MQKQNDHENLLRHIKDQGYLDAVGQPLTIVDTAFKVIYQNQLHKNLLGEHQGQLCFKAYHNRDHVCDKCQLQMTFSDGKIHTLQKSRSTEHGVKYFEITASPLKNADQQVIAGIEIVKEITSRKKLEQVVLNIAKGVSFSIGMECFNAMAKHLADTLEVSYAYIAEIVPGKPNHARTLSLVADGGFIDNIEVDLTGTPCERVLEQNICSFPSNVQQLFPQAHMMAQMKVEGYIGKLLYSSKGKKLGLMSVMYRKPIENPEMIQSILSIYAARAAAEIERRNYELDLKRLNDDLERRVKLRTDELENTNRELNAKIHELQISHEALQYSEKRFRAAATTTADIIWEGDVRNNSLNWLGDIDGLLGYEAGKFPRTISGHMENIHPEDKDRLAESIEQAVNSGKTFHSWYRIKCKDGTYRYWIESGSPIEYENNKAVKWVGSVTDITERKQSEFKLIESERKYKGLSQEFNALLDGIPDRLILLTPELKIQWANKAFATHAGKKSSELYGEYCYALCCRISVPCRDCPALVSFKSGREEITRVMNTEGKIFDKRALPIKDETGAVKSVVEIARDITAKVQMEEEAKVVQAKLIHANKMTSLGTLVAGVAHEINNPNSFIMNNAQVFSEIWNDAVKVLSSHYRNDKSLSLAGIPFPELKKLAPKLLHGINDGTQRIMHIVDNLKNFSRPDNTCLDGKVDVNMVVITATSILSSQIKKFTDKYQVKCGEDLPAAKGSIRQIEQVIINLIMNALQSLPNKKAGVSIVTSLNKKAKKVEVKVIDEGRGISPDSLDRITEPFYTTRMDIGGTGLGLSISDAIIREHKGSLIIKSKEGEGTTVTIRLPLYISE